MFSSPKSVPNAERSTMEKTRTTFTLIRRIGSTNYRVSARCSERASETFEDKIFRLIRKMLWKSTKNVV